MESAASPFPVWAERLEAVRGVAAVAIRVVVTLRAVATVAHMQCVHQPDQAEADAQRAKLTMMGLDAKISEREQAGRQVYRVRLGPYDDKDVAERTKAKLDTGGIETALVRVQR